MKAVRSTSIENLTAPEAQVLVHGSPGKFGGGSEVFEKSILELVARGWLDTRESVEELRVRSDVRFVRGGRTSLPEARPLLASFDLFRKCSSEGWTLDDGVPGFALWQALYARYSTPSGYADMEVLPSLHARGLYERSDSGLIGMFLRSGWKQTRAGERLSMEIQNNLSVARERFTEWARKDPGRASEFLERSGATMLLLPSMYTEVSRLDGARNAVGTNKGSSSLDPEAFESLSALSEALDIARRNYSDGWGEGTGFFGGGLGAGGCGDGGGGGAGSC